VLDVTGLVREALGSEPGIQLAVLFGSAARGRLQSNSDLDIGLLGVEPARLGTLASMLSRVARRPVDVVALESAPPLLRFEVAREGRVLIERPAHAWSDFKAKAMVDWWDWAPHARRFHAASAARLRQMVSRGPA
jgi:predicted nucleotidyltransferase